jgi:dynein heavy chain
MLGKKPDWDTAKKEVLSDGGFLDKLKNYDKDNIDSSVLKKIQKNLNDPNMQVEVVSRVSKAATGLCMWVHAMDVYSRVAKEVGPKKEKLAQMNSILAEANAKLAVKQAELKAVVDKVDALQRTADETVAEKSRLAEEQALTASRLTRAEQLTSGLGAEGVRWKATMVTLGKLREDLIGDTFLSCAAISYYGPFTGGFRRAIMNSWLERCRNSRIPLSENYSLVATLGDPVEVREWQNYSLPSDTVSIDNGILVKRARRWPLMVDPQGQANRWVRKMEASNDVSITTMKDLNLLRTLENCVRVGNPLLIEDVEENIEPALEPILQRAVYKQGNRLLVTIGDSAVDYDEKFLLYMTSKMPNPHYLPEICIKVTIINFTVTMAGLEDQLLAMTVVRERPDVEERKVSLLLQMAADSKQLAELEATILRMLAQSTGNILDDSILISTLAESKKTSTAIKERVAEAEKTEAEINNARESYRLVATRGSLIYFVIADLPSIDPMYQYSLEYFQSLFDRCLLQSEKSKELQKRLDTIINFTTIFMYSNICRGLFERDKVLFSSLLCFSILRQRGAINPNSWGFLIRGAGPVDRAGQSKNPNPTRISESQWDLLHACEDQVQLESNETGGEEDGSDIDETTGGDRSIGGDSSTVAPFQGIATSLSSSYNEWLEDWIDDEDPVRQKIPFGLNENGLQDGTFERLLLIKALREDKILEAMRRFVEIKLGERFALSPAASMSEIYADLSNCTPCIFILSKGADPTSILLRFAKEKKYADRMTIVSLGQGQGPYAEDLITKGCESGDWVFLQNCMLAKSWMPRLEAIVFQLAENQAKNNKDFRLYLSSSPAPYFPVSVLQNGVKMTNEPPAGVRANVARSFANLVKEETWSGCTKPGVWKKMLTALCFFHANIQERRKFGPLGWNILYAFDESDLEFSMSILKRMIEAQDEVPWDALNYITGQVGVVELIATKGKLLTIRKPKPIE